MRRKINGLWNSNCLVLSFFMFACIVEFGNCVAAESHYFTTSDGVRLHYIAEGAGETLLFVPGWLMPAEIWRRQIEYFSRKYRVIAFDPRSQGDSQVAPSGNNIQRRAEDLNELIEHLQSRRVVLIGWSLGVLEALLYIKTHGDDKVAALVFVDNSVGEEPPPKGGSTIRDRGPWDREREVADFVRAMFKSPQSPRYLTWLTGEAMRTPLEASLSLLSIPYPRTFWRSVIYETRKPLLYAVTASLKRQADNLRRKRKGTSIEVFAGAGHALFVDDHERFNSILDAFLATTLKESSAE
ncbi:MAG: alpha/beta hydrolase [Pseudomonadota bacterium]